MRKPSWSWLMNKIDTIEKSIVPIIVKEIQKESAKGQIIPTLYGNVDPDIFWACQEKSNADSAGNLTFKTYDPEKDSSASVNNERRTSAKAAGFIIFAYETPLSFDEKKFMAFIRMVPLNLFRIKGRVKFVDRTDMLNFVGGKYELIEWSDHPVTCLTFIGWNI
jgi:G3E family GTPase